MKRAPKAKVESVAAVLLLTFVAIVSPTNHHAFAQTSKITPESKDSHGDPLPLGARFRLGTVRYRCLSDVNAIAISPDGKWLTVCSLLGDNFAIFEAATGKSLKPPSMATAVTATAFSLDGKWLATATNERVEVWDTTAFKKVAGFSRKPLIENELAWVTSLAFSPNGYSILTGHTDKAATLWEWKSGKVLQNFREHKDWVIKIAFFPDGKKLVTSSYGETKLWDIASGKMQRGIDEGFVAMAPDGKLLATSPSRSPTVHLWPPSGEVPFKTIDVPGHFILSATVSKDSSMLAVNSSAEKSHVEIREIHLFDLKTGKLQRTLFDNNNGAWPILFSPQADVLISGAKHGTIRFWDPKTGKRARDYGGHENGVHAAAFFPDGKTVATAGADGMVFLWDPASGREKERLVGPRKGIWTMSISSDGLRVAGESSDRSAYVWNVGAKTPPLQIKFNEFPQCVVFTPDGRWLTIGSTTGEIQLFNPETGKAERTIVKLRKEPTVLSYSPDGNILAWGGYENDIRLFDIKSGKELQLLKGHSFWLRALSFSPDGKQLASGSDDGTARPWDLANGKSQILYQDPVKNQLHSVGAIRFSPDGALVLTGHWDGRIRLWEAFSRQEIASVQGHTGDVTSLAFSSDRRRFVSGSNDTTALVWEVPTILLGSGSVDPDWKAAWSDLADSKALTGQRAVWVFCNNGKEAPKILDAKLKETLSPEKIEGMDKVPKLLESLDSANYATREKAQNQLTSLGFPVLPALHKALNNKPPLEAKMRLEGLIRKIEANCQEQRLRLRRVLQILETSIEPQSASILERLATEGHEPEMIKASLQRLAEKKR